MLAEFNIWKFIAGLGIFLLAMSMIETGLNELAGRSFKKFLRRHTNRPLKAIFSGTIVTAILQSSSVVSLMVLALVGAGIIELSNAIGMILGSNLGTTFTGWIVAYFGFSFDIEDFAFPLIAMGGILLSFFNNRLKSKELGRLLMGLGFLFLGLEFMKSGIESYAENFDIAPFANWSPYLLFVVGFALTAVIQSSSASMVITLSALNAGLFPLSSAAAMVIGSDLGTTTTVLMGGINGTPAKKRVALSHFIYNFVVDTITLICLFPLLRFLTEVIGIKNPLMTLVAFHSSFNLLGIFIFLPFLKLFARFLERRFTKEENLIAEHINKVTTEVPEVALEVMRKEIRHLIDRVFHLQLNVMEIDNTAFYQAELLQKINDQSIIDQYNAIKELEGELVDFYLKIHNKPLNREEALQLKQLLLAIRHAMTAAKGIKDVAHNFKEFNRSVNDKLLQLLGIIKTRQAELYLDLYHIFQSPESKAQFELLTDLKKKSKLNYDSWLEKAYENIQQYQYSDIEVSTLFNINREMHNANKGLIAAVKDILLKPLQSDDYDAV